MNPGQTVVYEAPAKLNLCLFLGPLRGDGLHSICSLFQPIDLCDRVSISEMDSGGDRVVCPGIEGEDLAARALRMIREAGLDLPPLEVVIEKRIPVAAGMGGGSADAAAVLRHARRVLGETSVPALSDLASRIGSDVLAQSGLWSQAATGSEVARSIVSGNGSEVELAPAGDGFAAVLITSRQGLSTAAVYAEADRMGLARTEPELAGVADSLRHGSSGLPLVPEEAVVNDLQAAAISLRPELEDHLVTLREVGASSVLVTGSGPTVYGAFPDEREAHRAASELESRGITGVLVTGPLGAGSVAEAGS